jgi:DNA polymerase (family X)
MSVPKNREIADVLDTIAELLEAQDANPHRVRAYRTGAQTVRDAEQHVAELVHEGKQEDLRDLPGIGQALAGVIREYVETGRSGPLERLQGEMAPGELFAQVPGIGPTLGQQIAEELDVQSLEGLERAAHDGRLQEVEGFGEERVHNVRVALAGMLSRAAQRRAIRDQAEKEGQATVVTARGGSLQGRRIVRGRETESREYYERRGGGGP